MNYCKNCVYPIIAVNIQINDEGETTTSCSIMYDIVRKFNNEKKINFNFFYHFFFLTLVFSSASTATNTTLESISS